MREGRATVRQRFPHRMIQKHTAAGEGAVQFGASVSRMALLRQVGPVTQRLDAPTWRIIFPRALPDSPRRCACAASASANSWLTTMPLRIAGHEASFVGPPTGSSTMSRVACDLPDALRAVVDHLVSTQALDQGQAVDACLCGDVGHMR